MDEVKYPALFSAEEEKEVYEAWLAGSKEAKDQLLEHTLGSLAEICQKYASEHCLEDLMQVGCVGLIKGLEQTAAEGSIQKIMLETAEKEIKEYINR